MNGPVRVLVAEDNEDHQFFIIRALKGVAGVGFEVDAVRDGEEALDFLYQRGRFEGQPRPHMILMDLKMPKVDGIEVIERIKADPVLKTIPIMMLTSSDRKEDIDAAYAAGGNAYVKKQPSFNGLRSELEAASEYWTNVAVLPDPPA